MILRSPLNKRSDEFIHRTDRKPLFVTRGLDDPTDRLSRLSEALRRYGYNVQVTASPGTENISWLG